MSDLPGRPVQTYISDPLTALSGQNQQQQKPSMQVTADHPLAFAAPPPSVPPRPQNPPSGQRASPPNRGGYTPYGGPSAVSASSGQPRQQQPSATSSQPYYQARQDAPSASPTPFFKPPSQSPPPHQQQVPTQANPTPGTARPSETTHGSYSQQPQFSSPQRSTPAPAPYQTGPRLAQDVRPISESEQIERCFSEFFGDSRPPLPQREKSQGSALTKEGLVHLATQNRHSEVVEGARALLGQSSIHLSSDHSTELRLNSFLLASLIELRHWEEAEKTLSQIESRFPQLFSNPPQDKIVAALDLLILHAMLPYHREVPQQSADRLCDLLALVHAHPEVGDDDVQRVEMLLSDVHLHMKDYDTALSYLNSVLERVDEPFQLTYRKALIYLQVCYDLTVLGGDKVRWTSNAF